MSDSLERLEQLRKSMVSDVAHELRTPLTNLRGYLEGLSDGIIPPDKATFDMLQQENLRLVNLVEDLGQLARADAARAYLDRRPVDLSSCISEMLNLYRMNIDEKQIRVITQFNDGATTVSADRDKLLQAVRNLIDNCLKYTPAGGTVTITSTRTADDVRVDFINDGPGIPAAELPYVFERFFRAEYSRSRDARRRRDRPGHRQAADRGPRRSGWRRKHPRRDPHLVRTPSLTSLSSFPSPCLKKLYRIFTAPFSSVYSRLLWFCDKQRKAKGEDHANLTTRHRNPADRSAGRFQRYGRGPAGDGESHLRRPLL